MQQDRIQVSVFTNNRKRNEKSPDYSGMVTFPDGKEMEIALWNSKSKAGMPYMRGFISEKFQPKEGGSAPRQSNAVAVDF